MRVKILFKPSVLAGFLYTILAEEGETLTHNCQVGEKFRFLTQPPVKCMVGKGWEVVEFFAICPAFTESSMSRKGTSASLLLQVASSDNMGQGIGLITARYL